MGRIQPERENPSVNALLHGTSSVCFRSLNFVVMRYGTEVFTMWVSDILLGGVFPVIPIFFTFLRLTDYTWVRTHRQVMGQYYVGKMKRGRAVENYFGSQKLTE